jgi:hypothetical protein
MTDWRRTAEISRSMIEKESRIWSVPLWFMCLEVSITASCQWNWRSSDRPWPVDRVERGRNRRCGLMNSEEYFSWRHLGKMRGEKRDWVRD